MQPQGPMTLQQALSFAVSHHQQGRFQQAEQVYRQILAVDPNQPDALHLLGLLAVQVGRADMGLPLLSRAVALRPADAAMQSNLTVALTELQRFDEAIEAGRRAVQADPRNPDAACNLGVALLRAGRPDEAEPPLRTALQIAPEHLSATRNLALTLSARNDHKGAVALLRQVVALAPNDISANTELAQMLMAAGELDEAAHFASRILATWPQSAQGHLCLGHVLKRRGDLPAATDAWRRALDLEPTNAQACLQLGLLAMDAMRLDESLALIRRAIASQPDLGEAHLYAAVLLNLKYAHEEAEQAARKAIKLLPRSAKAHGELGLALSFLGRLEEAIASYRAALALDPDLTTALVNLSNALKDTGEIQESIRLSRRVLELTPQAWGAASNLIFGMQFDPDASDDDIAVETNRWHERYAAGLARTHPVAPRDPSRRKLRVGYVSGDFRMHAVAMNVIKLFRHHDRERFEVVAFSASVARDSVTEEFRRLSDQWFDISTTSDEDAAELVARERIDILADLSLHTSWNRLPLFARKPAPVQVSFAGYPGTTGLRAIDYRLSDPFLDPPDRDESLYSERTWRLPDSFWCYDPLTPPDQSPLPSPLPALTNGYLTFGCLNNACKVNRQVVSLWSRVLREVSKSKLLMLAPDGLFRRRLHEWFAADGIPPDRIEFVPRQRRENYLQTYHRIDLGLDTFPYNGHTTSLDSFWMGVPVVTLAGGRAVTRAGWCQLSNLGLAKLAAWSPDEFVTIASSLAQDLERLRNLRQTLRERTEHSPLMDGPRYTRNVEQAYTHIWHEALSISPTTPT